MHALVEAQRRAGTEPQATIFLFSKSVSKVCAFVEDAVACRILRLRFELCKSQLYVLSFACGAFCDRSLLFEIANIAGQSLQPKYLQAAVLVVAFVGVTLG